MTRPDARPTAPGSSVASPDPIGTAGSHDGTRARRQQTTGGGSLVGGVAGRGRTGGRRRADILASTKETR
jgi:hypothetical protein